ncbi:MAG: hypothetical protein QXQ66_08250, partial [Candidatus Hadarchaeum sp.]|uniref:hypothetical protein n=1 Tax=Candidatus Hadarchaeum sp. TaxID=2883567 RepID=UPI0031763ECB
MSVKAIEDSLPAFSVFTWPFRLSFNHDKSKKDTEGNYPQELEGKIDHFRSKFKPGESLVFFYLNYDNPISAEENKYALVGCSLLKKDIPRPKDFQFDPDELNKLRKYKEFKNFPEMNWAMLVSYDPENTIILPYKEYLDKIDENPEDESWREKLDEMKVLIEEEALIPSFKYVANEIDDDGCIYLLYKLRKAILLVQDHGFDFSRESKLIEKFLAHVWNKRGLYPSLGNILDVVGEFDPELKVRRQLEDKKIGSQIVNKISEKIGNQDLLEVTFKLLTSNSPIPDYLAELSSYIKALRANIRDYEGQIELLKKLSLFSLTTFQIKRIIQREDSEKIVKNPYILAEDYSEKWEESYLDLPEMPDSP